MTNATTNATEGDSSDLARRLVAEMQHEIGARSPSSTSPIVTKWFRRVSVSLIGCLFVLDAAMSILDHGDITVRAPSNVIARYELDTCAQRQASIMRAIAAYRDKNGELPRALAMLSPPDLQVPPVDPDSNRPYIYDQSGEHITLECPNPELHKHPKASR